MKGIKTEPEPPQAGKAQTKIEKMFEKLLTKIEQMLYILLEQEFARTKIRVRIETKSVLKDIKAAMIQLTSKKGGDRNASSYLLRQLGDHRGGGLSHAAGLGCSLN